jgi:TetR/AcrR family transcriptional regulator, transcriptional repressor for nem operon
MTSSSERGLKTKQKMIRAAMDLFHAQGVRATSPQEVIDRSDTGKSQFYHYFGSKEGLVHETLQYFYAEMCEGKYNNQPITSWKDLERWFEFFVAALKHYHCERGCPIGTIGYELRPDQELIRQDVNAIFLKSLANLARFFDSLKAQKKLKPGTDPDELAGFCFTAVQGGLLVSKAQRNTRPMETTVKHALAYLKSLAV